MIFPVISLLRILNIIALTWNNSETLLSIYMLHRYERNNSRLLCSKENSFENSFPEHYQGSVKKSYIWRLTSIVKETVSENGFLLDIFTSAEG